MNASRLIYGGSIFLVGLLAGHLAHVSHLVPMGLVIVTLAFVHGLASAELERDRLRAVMKRTDDDA